jgi:hypothetical protein
MATVRQSDRARRNDELLAARAVKGRPPKGQKKPHCWPKNAKYLLPFYAQFILKIYLDILYLYCVYRLTTDEFS